MMMTKRAHYITELIESFFGFGADPHDNDGVWSTTKDIGSGIHTGLSVVGKVTSKGIHAGDQVLHHFANATEYVPAVTGAAALGGGYALHRYLRGKRDMSLAY